MKKQQRLYEKYVKMNIEFNDLNRRAKHLKQEMSKIRTQINITGSNVEEREDEILLKS